MPATSWTPAGACNAEKIEPYTKDRLERKWITKFGTAHQDDNKRIEERLNKLPEETREKAVFKYRDNIFKYLGRCENCECNFDELFKKDFESSKSKYQSISKYQNLIVTVHNIVNNLVKKGMRIPLVLPRDGQHDEKLLLTLAKVQ